MLTQILELAIETAIAQLFRKKSETDKEQSVNKDQESRNSGCDSSDQNSVEDDISDIEKKYVEYFNNNWSDVIHNDDGWRSRTEIVNRDRELVNHIYSKDTTIVRCQPMVSRNKHNSFRFPKYDVPKEVSSAVYEDKDPDTEFPMICEKVNPRNYSYKFHLLLYYEEAAMYLSMRNFDMDLQKLNRCGEYMTLQVARGMTSRNTLIGGNRVLLTHPTRVPKLTFEGFIHKIKGDFILMRFHDEFHRMYDGTAYNVSFHCSRAYFRQSHYAVDLVHRHLCNNLLFPVEKQLLRRMSLWKGEASKLRFVQSGLNSRQKNAVVGVLRSPQRPAPYIIVGPKNSGKTTSLIEAVLQVVSKIKKSRIIVCTNSNVGADFVAIKLLESNVIHDDKLTRLVSFNYSKYIDERLKPVCMIFKDDPHDNDWLYRKVIVTTCTNAGNLYCMLKNSQHFTHCFIDDSTKATEPETLVALGLVAPGLGVTVLTGDPTHAKPMCESSIARQHGLNETFMIRLMQMDLYRASKLYTRFGDYNPYYITKLDEVFEEKK